MTIYKAPLDDLRFALFDVLGAEAVLTKLQGGEGHTRDLLDAVLEEAGRLSEAVLAPINAFADGGWTGLTQAEHFGGQALPNTMGTATTEIFQSGNLSWSLYPLLSEGA